jgi:hypothetical protein
VVLAAWAAQNPRMLLNSATDKHAKGLANSNGLVGKYMMTHFSSGTFAIFDEDVENHMGTTGAQYMSYDRYGKTSHKAGFGSSFIIAGAALKTSGLGGFANARLDLFGADLQAFMKRAARGFTRIVAFGEELPNIENRIELVSDKDEFSMPLAKIIHNYDKDAEAVWNANFDEGLEIAKATNAKEAWSARGNMPTIHLMGGTIMGPGSANSVVKQLRPDPRDPEPLPGRSRHLPDCRRFEPDLHDLRSLAARCRAAGRGVEHGRRLTPEKRDSNSRSRRKRKSRSLAYLDACRSRVRTAAEVHVRPRTVRRPRALSAAAMSPSEAIPPAWIWRTTGTTLLTNRSSRRREDPLRGSLTRLL